MPTGYSAGSSGEILTLAARYTRFTMVVDVGLSTEFGDRALDLETERLLFAQMAELEGRTTVLVVTHRPSLVERQPRVPGRFGPGDRGACTRYFRNSRAKHEFVDRASIHPIVQVCTGLTSNRMSNRDQHERARQDNSLDVLPTVHTMERFVHFPAARQFASAPEKFSDIPEIH